MSEVIPDVSEPIIGWRMWRYELSEVVDDFFTADPDPSVLTQSPLTASLFSLAHKTYWPPREALQAMCSGHPAGPLGPWPNHLSTCDCVPDRRRSCGIYAMKSLRDVLWGMPRLPEPVVVGQVALWGRVVVHEYGYRAEFGYPQHLYMPLLDPPKQPRLFAVEDPREEERAALEIYGVPVELADLSVSLEPWRRT